MLKTTFLSKKVSSHSKKNKINILVSFSSIISLVENFLIFRFI